uniref:Xrn1 helical domain-containing protein n=1 Tax=Arundo donax TaxID=35708 RepID=A0A0A9CEH9_ARUDO
MHEMRRNTTRQEKIFMRNSNALANNEAFVQTSRCSPQRLLIDSATSEIGGWVSPDDNNDPINGSFRSPIKNLDDITYDEAISATFFNPEVVKPIARLLDNVWVPDKTVRESDISKMPLWHTYRGLIPPCM